MDKNGDPWETSWDTWDISDNEVKFDPTKISLSLAEKMLTRRCLGILDRLAALEKNAATSTTIRETASDLLGATIVTAQSYMQNDLILDDLLYITSMWREPPCKGWLINNDKTIVESTISLLEQMAKEGYGTSCNEP